MLRFLLPLVLWGGNSSTLTEAYSWDGLIDLLAFIYLLFYYYIFLSLILSFSCLYSSRSRFSLSFADSIASKALNSFFYSNLSILSALFRAFVSSCIAYRYHAAYSNTSPLAPPSSPNSPAINYGRPFSLRLPRNLWYASIKPLYLIDSLIFLNSLSA